MGSLILCHDKKALQPYKITRIHRKIYTIEELCYYLCNNLYLIDYTIMNDKICEWLYTELDMKDLAKELLDLIQKNGSIEQFVLKILEYAKIYSSSEMEHIRNVLDRLKDQKEIERRKYKADNLLESGEHESAILVYLSILQDEKDESAGDRFYGKVYGCLGTAYGRELLYEQAASMYKKAYEICRDDTMLMAYVYACSRHMQAEDYHKLLLDHPDYNQAAEKIAGLDAPQFQESEDSPRDTIEKWKQQYRRYI